MTIHKPQTDRLAVGATTIRRFIMDLDTLLNMAKNVSALATAVYKVGYYLNSGAKAYDALSS